MKSIGESINDRLFTPRHRSWSDEELADIRAQFERAEPHRWAELLRMDNDLGFVTNENNDRFIEALGPICGPTVHKGNLRLCAMQIRFLTDRERRFQAWQPGSSETRSSKFDAYRKSEAGGVFFNGKIIWSREQMEVLREHLREKRPGLWRRYCALNKEIGFCDHPTEASIDSECCKVFAFPADVDHSTSVSLFRCCQEEEGFYDAGPDNKFWDSWFWSGQDGMSWDDWYRDVRRTVS